VQHVEDLAAHVVGGGLHGEDHRVGDVAHVHERAPHPAAAVQRQAALEQRVLDERVDHEVVAHARAPAVHGAVAQAHRHEPLAGHAEQGLLAVALGGGVGAVGLDVGGLVVHAERQAVVERARGREHEPLDPVVHARAAHRLGGHRVHLPVGLGVVLGGRVVREAGEVDHGVDALEGARRHVAHVRLDEVDPVAELGQRPLAPVEAVEQADPVAAIEQARDQDAADVARAAGDQHRLAGLGRLGRKAVASHVAARQRHSRLSVLGHRNPQHAHEKGAAVRGSDEASSGSRRYRVAA
jgi:hypothetical protein